MRFPIKSLFVTLAALLASGGTATSENIVGQGPDSLPVSVEAINGVTVLGVSGPEAASYSVIYFDGSGRAQEVASGSLGASGVAEAVTPELGVGVTGMAYAEIWVRLSGGEVLATKVQALDPLFLWQ